MKQLIGITGGSGSGKTTISKLFKGFKIINADDIYKNLLGSDINLINSLKSLFPDTFDDNILNKKRLANIVFANPIKLELLNNITHPFIENKVLEIIETLGENSKILYDCPLLFEGSIKCDKTIGVIADEYTRINRIVLRDNIDESLARLRIKNQKANSFYEKYCDFIIYNNGENLQNQIENIRRRI